MDACQWCGHCSWYARSILLACIGSRHGRRALIWKSPVPGASIAPNGILGRLNPPMMMIGGGHPRSKILRQAREAGGIRAGGREPLMLPLVVPVLRPPFPPSQHSVDRTALTPYFLQRLRCLLRSLATRAPWAAQQQKAATPWAPRCTPAAKSRRP